MQIKYLIPKNEFLKPEERILYVEGKFFKLGYSQMAYLDNVFVQVVPKEGASNIIYDIYNRSILPENANVQDGYVTVFTESRDVDKTKEYFVDH